MTTKLLLCAALLVAGVARAEAPAKAAGPVQPGAVRAGDRAPSFSLPVPGRKDAVALDALVAQSKLTVVLIVATRCPVSKAYDDRMAAIAKDYAAKGVAFVGINGNANEPDAEVAEHAARFSFPVAKDGDRAVIDRFGAKVTPEAYVVDRAGVVRYHGRLDGSQADAKKGNASDLRAALDALLAGQEPPQAETKAFGCSIKR